MIPTPAPNAESWVAWFEGALARYRSPWHYLLDLYTYYLPVIGALASVHPPPARLLDLGSGIASRAFCLNSWGYECTGIDKDPGVRALAATMPWAPWVRTVAGDFWAPPAGPWDVCTSFGVIEHCAEETQIALLRIQAQTAPTCLVVVPSPLLLDVEPPVYGEERMRLDQLVDRAERAGWTVRQAFGWGDPPQRSDARDRLTPPQWRYRQVRGEDCLSYCVIGGRPTMGSMRFTAPPARAC